MLDRANGRLMISRHFHSGRKHWQALDRNRVKVASHCCCWRMCAGSSILPMGSAMLSRKALDFASRLDCDPTTDSWRLDLASDCLLNISSSFSNLPVKQQASSSRKLTQVRGSNEKHMVDRSNQTILTTRLSWLAPRHDLPGQWAKQKNPSAE